jgi:glutamine amidotransferase
MKSEIGIIDYGMSNILSIVRAVEKIGARPILLNDGKRVSEFEKIILPGVGAFPLGIKELKTRGIFDQLIKIPERNQYILGVCLGMQMLLSSGEEIEETAGLNLIEGRVKRLPIDRGFKVPNVNWHRIENSKAATSILPQVDSDNLGLYMYFVHSYYVEPSSESVMMCTTTLGDFTFCSGVAYKRVFGVQFHPEKSGEKGLELLSNFVNI